MEGSGGLVSPVGPACAPLASVPAPSRGGKIRPLGYKALIERGFPAPRCPPVPPLRTATLSSGLSVVLLEDPDTSFVRGSLLSPRGDLSDAVPGTGAVLAGALRQGGSRLLPGTQLDEALERSACYVEVGTGPESTSVEWGGLVGQQDFAFDAFRSLLLEPAYGREAVGEVLDAVAQSLAHRNDSPGGVAGREASRLAWGTGSPLAAVPDARVLASTLKSGEVLGLEHKLRLARPQGAVLGLSGPGCASDAALARLESSLSSSPAYSGQVEKIDASTLADGASRGTVGKTLGEGVAYVVDFPGATTAHVALAARHGCQLGDAPDCYALDTVNAVLNGFGGRLFDQVRSRAGLAYSVSGGWALPLGRPGLFRAGGQTAAPSVGKFVAEVNRVLYEAGQEAPSEVELEAAKDAALESFVFNFSTPRQQLQRAVSYAALGLPPDYLFTYRDALARVTADECLQATRRHLSVNGLVLVVSGDAKTLVPALERDLGVSCVAWEPA